MNQCSSLLHDMDGFQDIDLCYGFQKDDLGGMFLDDGLDDLDAGELCGELKGGIDDLEESLLVELEEPISLKLLLDTI